MNKRTFGANIALMVVFGAIGLTLFTENVRTVQILGVFICGAIFGAALAGTVSAFRSRRTQA